MELLGVHTRTHLDLLLQPEPTTESLFLPHSISATSADDVVAVRPEDVVVTLAPDNRSSATKPVFLYKVKFLSRWSILSPVGLGDRGLVLARQSGYPRLLNGPL